MTHRPTASLTRLLAFLTLVSSIAAGASAQESQPEAQSVLKLLDSIDLPKVEDKPFVKVTYKWRDQGPKSRYVAASFVGVLLSSKGREFRVLTTDLEDLELTLITSGDADATLVSYEVLNLKHQAKALLAKLDRELTPQDPPKGGEEDDAAEEEDADRGMFDVERYHRVRTEAAVLAWICARNRLPSLSTRFMQRAVLNKGEILADLRVDLAHVRLWRMVVAFEDVSISWRDHLDRFERLAKMFPDSEENKRVARTLVTLKRMVSQSRPTTAGAKATERERVAQLLYDIRDSDWLTERRRRAKGPHEALVKIGFAAVPQLIAALLDDTLTRRVKLDRDFYFSHFSVRVGTCALFVLEEITKQEFFKGRYLFEPGVVTEAARVAVKARAEAWWKKHTEGK